MMSNILFTIFSILGIFFIFALFTRMFLKEYNKKDNDYVKKLEFENTALQKEVELKDEEIRQLKSSIRNYDAMSDYITSLENTINDLRGNQK